MRRGEIWTAAGGAAYTGKPRPVLIVQDDRFDDNDSITVCPLTSDRSAAPMFRVRVKSAAENGLLLASAIVVDKLTTLPRANLGRKVGKVGGQVMADVEDAILIFLGIRR